LEFDEQGALLGGFGTVQDITERKHAETELLRAKQEWERTFDSVPDLIAILDTEHRIIRANRELAERLGKKKEECAGLPCYVAIHCTDAPSESCPHAKTIRDGLEHVSEVHEDRLGGDFMVSTTPLFDERGVLLGSVHVARDITERKKMENELRRSRDELEMRVQQRTAELRTYMAKLEKSNQALQDFAFMASHDLREPLRKVSAFGAMLRHKYQDLLGRTGNDYLYRMIDAALRMDSLLAGLLAYSRVTTTAEPFREVDLDDIVCEVLSDLEIKVKKAGAEVQVEELPSLEADPTQMRQLFQNLLGNALKFHKAGEKPVIKVSASIAENCDLLIQVEDNGIGFDERYADGIFAPFQRLHGRTGHYEGTGMGLAICKKIVERHNGSIMAKSTPQAGSTFIIRLPAKQSQ
jgi:PAS domain S-box-containing protein